MANVNAVVFLNAMPYKWSSVQMSQCDTSGDILSLNAAKPAPTYQNAYNAERVVPTGAVLNFADAKFNLNKSQLSKAGRLAGDVYYNAARQSNLVALAFNLSVKVDGRYVCFPNVYISRDGEDAYIYQNWRCGTPMSLSGSRSLKALDFVGYWSEDTHWRSASEYSFNLVEYDQTTGTCYIMLTKIGDLNSGLATDLFPYISKSIEYENRGGGQVNSVCRSIMSDAYAKLHGDFFVTLEARHFAGGLSNVSAEVDPKSVSMVGGVSYISNSVIRNNTDSPKTIKLPDYKLTYTDTSTTTLDHSHSTREYGTIAMKVSLRIGTKENNITPFGEINSTSEHTTENREVTTNTHTETRDYVVPGQTVVVGPGEAFKAMVVWKKAMTSVRFTAKFDAGQFVPAWANFTNPVTGEAFGMWVTVDLMKVADKIGGYIPSNVLDIDYMSPNPKALVSQSYIVEGQQGVNAQYKIEKLSDGKKLAMVGNSVSDHAVDYVQAKVIY